MTDTGSTPRWESFLKYCCGYFMWNYIYKLVNIFMTFVDISRLSLRFNTLLQLVENCSLEFASWMWINLLNFGNRSDHYIRQLCRTHFHERLNHNSHHKSLYQFLALSRCRYDYCSSEKIFDNSNLFICKYSYNNNKKVE